MAELERVERECEPYPSTRELAERVGAVVSTVHVALDSLRRQGLVENHAGWGAARRPGGCGARHPVGVVCRLQAGHLRRGEPHTDRAGFSWSHGEATLDLSPAVLELLEGPMPAERLRLYTEVRDPAGRLLMVRTEWTGEEWQSEAAEHAGWTRTGDGRRVVDAHGLAVLWADTPAAASAAHRVLVGQARAGTL